MPELVRVLQKEDLTSKERCTFFVDTRKTSDRKPHQPDQLPEGANPNGEWQFVGDYNDYSDSGRWQWWPSGSKSLVDRVEHQMPTLYEELAAEARQDPNYQSVLQQWQAGSANRDEHVELWHQLRSYVFKHVHEKVVSELIID